MNITHSDFKKGIVKLRITDPEDLWYLSHLVDPGDFVKGKTTRKVRIGDSENAKVAKKTYFLRIEAETVNFSEDGSSLRINGKVKEGSEDVPLDSYQAIALELGSEFVLEKVNWLEYQKQKLQESTEKKYNYLILLFDREEALFALTKSFGYEILVKLKGDVHKKAEIIDIKKDFHGELIKALDVYSGRYSPEGIIVASPAFFKEDLLKKITNKELKEKIVLATCSDVSETSLDEVIKRPELAETLKSSRSRQERIVVDELLSEINKDKLAVYGAKEVLQAVEAGAVSKLILTDDYIQRNREAGNYEQLDQLMKKIDSLKGKIHIISAEQESGKELEGLGGIAATLRYKLKW